MPSSCSRPTKGVRCCPWQRLEPALGAALADHPEGGERLGKALEPGRTEIGQLEQATKQAPGRLADDHAAGLRESLEPGRQVGGLADHRLLPGGAHTDQLADHDQTGRYPDAGRQWFSRWSLQLRECLDHR
jgi:hypothetical protein